jgi:hypothetical protein
MELNASLDLVHAHAKRDALIAALGEAAAKLLETRFPYVVDTHTLSARERLRAFKNGRTFCQLILEDGAIDSSALVGGGQHCRDVERLQEETNEFVQQATCLCESIHVLLGLLEQFCEEHTGDFDCVDLVEIAAPDDDPEATFFVELNFGNEQSTGCFARAVSEALRESVNAWLKEFVDRIAETFEIDRAEPSGFLRRMSRELSQVICDHVSLNGLFDQSLKKRGHALTAEKLAKLYDSLFDREVMQECENIRLKTIDDLNSLVPFCVDGAGSMDKAVEAAISKSKTIRRVCADPPLVLRDRAGFDARLFRLDELAEIVREREELRSKVFKWKRSVGRGNLANLHDYLVDSARIMKQQQIGFLPTLGNCRPPDPPWTDPGPVACSYIKALDKLPKQTLSSQSAVYTPMSPDVHAGMRLLSAVWECLGDDELYRALFFPGRARCRLLQLCVFEEQKKLNQALLSLRVWAQQARLGENYRNAARQLREWRRHPKYELELRSIARKLAPFSLNDLMTVAHEGSPLFYMYEFRVLDRTLSSMQSRPRFMFTELVRQTMHHFCPILCELRREAMLCPSASSSSLIEGLMSLPQVRDWDRQTDELVLTGEQVKRGLGGVRAALLQLASVGRLVHFGKRPSKERATYGNKRVFTLNGSDLRNVLEGTTAPLEDAGS